MSQIGQAVASRSDRVRQGLRGDRQLHFADLHDVPQFLLPEELGSRNGYRSDLQPGEEGSVELGNGGEPNEVAVTRLHSKRCEGIPQTVDQVLQFLIGDLPSLEMDGSPFAKSTVHPSVAAHRGDVEPFG